MRLMVSFSRSRVFYELDFPTLFLALHPSLYLFHMVALESFNYVGTGFYCCIICFRVGRIHTYLEPMKVSSNGNMHTWILLILFSRFCSFTSYFCSKCPVCLHGLMSPWMLGVWSLWDCDSLFPVFKTVFWNGFVFLKNTEANQQVHSSACPCVVVSWWITFLSYGFWEIQFNFFKTTRCTGAGFTNWNPVLSNADGKGQVEAAWECESCFSR